MFIGTMVIELREFNDKKKKKKKNMDKVGKLFLLITLTKNGILVKYLAYSFILANVVLQNH